VIHVRPEGTPIGKTLFMQHGQIDHGTQFVNPKLQHIPTGYYGRFSGVGLAIERYRALVDPGNRGLRIGIVGLGTGTLCTYGRSHDSIRIYEIDKEVERLARRHFTYLEDCKSEVEVVIGDARVVLERELVQASRQFDILVIDAFSSDAIPVHLLTREAVALYRAHLKPGGVLALHASNAHLAVPAVARGAIEDGGLVARRITDTGDERYDGAASDWILASERPDFLDEYEILVAATPWTKYDREPILWTDDFSSLWTASTMGREPGKWRRAPNSGRFVVDLGNMITYDDRTRIADVCRKLYSDSDGNITLIAMTYAKRKRIGVEFQSLDVTSKGIYSAIGLGKRERDTDMLLIVTRQEKLVHVQMGPDWPSEIRGRVREILVSTLSKGMQAGYPSSSYRRAVEQLATLIRESATR